MKHKDITGQTFGRLTVRQEYGLAKDKHMLWLCDCQCGQTHIASGATLRNGTVKSCGCLYRESRARIARNWIQKGSEKTRRASQRTLQNAKFANRLLQRLDGIL